MIKYNDLVFSLEDPSQTKLSTNDVLLQPSIGILKSRSEAIIDSSFIFSSPMDVVTGLNMSEAMLNKGQSPVFCRFLPLNQKVDSILRFHSQDNFWYSVGAFDSDWELIEYLHRTKQLPDDFYLNISVDIAHGATKDIEQIYKTYSRFSWCKKLMSGTVATPEAAAFVYNAGCTHVRIGIGPGSACSTRIVTGCGYPNLSAVYEIYRSFQFQEISDAVLIADGGIKNTGDIAKYLAAGADGVMIGSMLSSIIESEGWIHKIFHTPYKYYRGQASAEFQKEKRGKINGVPEGVQNNKKIYPTKSFAKFNSEVKAALASTISYLAIKQISDLKPENVKFVKITSSGFNESRPHILN